MALFGGSKVENTDKFQQYLCDGETIEQVYKLILDEICFTNKRVIFFDNKLVSKKKKRVSIPWKSIDSYAIEEAGHFDMDAEAHLFVKGQAFELEFKKGTDMREVEKMLANHICK
jgi:hypothetical protein